MAQNRASWAIESFIVQSPYFTPSRLPTSTCGAFVIDSMPPATTMSNSPARISWSARAIASMPDRHTLLMVSAGTSSGIPPATAAWRAVIWPAPAWMTCPMITYCTWSPDTPALSSAPLMAMPPRSVAENPFRDPSNRPIGVRAPATITDPDMACLSLMKPGVLIHAPR